MLLLIIGSILIWTGAYNVAASAGHSAIVRMILSSSMERSVKARAGGTAPRFDAAMIRSGGIEYKGMCEQCHGGPGTKRADWAQGMSPIPPDLIKEAAEWTPEQIHWIVEHGIKMSGMPGFGATHDTKTIWNIAGFVKQLPGMSAQTYDALPAEEQAHHPILTEQPER